MIILGPSPIPPRSGEPAGLTPDQLAHVRRLERGDGQNELDGADNHDDCGCGVPPPDRGGQQGGKVGQGGESRKGGPTIMMTVGVASHRLMGGRAAGDGEGQGESTELSNAFVRLGCSTGGHKGQHSVHGNRCWCRHQGALSLPGNNALCQGRIGGTIDMGRCHRCMGV